MTESPNFFVPGTEPGTEEAVYAELAKSCGATIADPDKRVYSITFMRDGVEWTATVGELLHGIGRKRVGRRGTKNEQQISHSDPATVRAIFAGVPYQVKTDGVRTQWANPFLAGQPVRVRHFSPPK